MRHGVGNVTYSDGSTYRGHWLNDYKHGKGVFKWIDESKYYGTFVEDKMDGYGTFTFPSQDHFISDRVRGYFGLRKILNGKTIDYSCAYVAFSLPNYQKGKRYALFLDDKIIIGPAICESYQGYFQDNMAEGEGILKY